MRSHNWKNSIRNKLHLFAAIVFAAVISCPTNAESPRWPADDSLDLLYETGETDELVAAGILASIGAGKSQHPVEDFFLEALERDPSHVLASHGLLVHCAKTANVPICTSDAYLRKAVGNDADNGGMWVAYAAMKHKYVGADAALPLVRRATDAAVYDSYFVSYMTLFDDVFRANVPLLPKHHQGFVMGASGRSAIEVRMYGICQSESDAEWTAVCLALGQHIEESSAMPTMVGIGQKFQISMHERNDDPDATRRVEQRRDVLVRSLDAPDPSRYFGDNDPFWYELMAVQINDGDLAAAKLIRERVGDSSPINRSPQQRSRDELIDQVTEGLAAAATVKARTAEFIITEKRAPANRKEAGMTPNPEENSGDYVRGVDVVDGQVVITYGHHADERLHGLTLVFTPYVTDSMSLVWQCGYAPPPVGLATIGGYDLSSSLPPDLTPPNCLP